MRSNADWIAALDDSGDGQAAALGDLRTHLLRASLFTLHRALHSIGHPDSTTVRELAEDCAHEALTGILERLHAFRGDSQFTTWAYAFAVLLAPVVRRSPARRVVRQRGSDRNSMYKLLHDAKIFAALRSPRADAR